jgi:hypothetical protein
MNLGLWCCIGVYLIICSDMGTRVVVLLNLFKIAEFNDPVPLCKMNVVAWKVIVFDFKYTLLKVEKIYRLFVLACSITISLYQPYVRALCTADCALH